MKKNVGQAVAAYRILNRPEIKFSKMSSKGKFAIIKANRALKAVATDYDDFSKDAFNRLKPDNYDEFSQKERSQYTDEENAAYAKLDRELTEILNSELDKEKEFEFEALDEESFGQFLDSNDITVSEAMMLMDVLVS